MQVQAILKLILSKENEWPQQITNGTVMVMEKFYETSVHDIPSSPGLVHSVLYKIFNGPDYSVTRYSVTHFADFLRGMQLVLELLKVPNAPGLLLGYTDRARSLMKHKHIEQLISEDPSRKLSPNKVLYYGRFLRTQYKRQAEELIEIYSQLDAWYSMAVATKRMNLKFPNFSEQEEPLIEARGLYHILLADPVAYDVELMNRLQVAHYVRAFAAVLLLFMFVYVRSPCGANGHRQTRRYRRSPAAMHLEPYRRGGRRSSFVHQLR